MRRRRRLPLTGRGRGLLLREEGGAGAPVDPIELFFDLVYVFAFTQLTQLLLRDLSPRGAIETLLLLMAVWAAWSFTTWTTSRFDARTLPVRLLLIAVMLGSLFMSASIPAAFADRGLDFAIAYVALQVGRNAVTLVAIGRGHPLSGSFLRVLLWSLVAGAFWIAGGLADGNGRVRLWAMAVAIDYLVSWLGFPIPGLGRTRTAEWSISGRHLAERNELFIILALGESILITGITYSQIPRSSPVVIAFVVAFIASVALWWIYFDRSAAAGREAIAQADDPGWIGLSAYSYSHLPMVGGIIMAASADKMTIAHPLALTAWAWTLLLLGGPALYLAGNTLFTWVLTRRVPWSRLVAIAGLVALAPVTVGLPALLVMSAAMLVIVALAAWDLRAARLRHGSIFVPLA